MRDASELKRLHSEDIRDVEVINAPGAQYDAQVRAVVRIRTRKQQGDGLSLDATISSSASPAPIAVSTPLSSCCPILSGKARLKRVRS